MGFVSEEIFALPDKIKLLREHLGLTQTQLSKQLGLTRSSVNAWEMGISVPSTQYIVELSKIFGVSTDYLFGIGENAVISVNGLGEREVAVIAELVACLRDKEQK